MQDLAIRALNVSLMLSVGLELKPTDLRRALHRRGTLFIATGINFLLVPALAWAVSEALGLAAPLATGMLLASASPGGGTGTLLTRTAGGNLELSVVLLLLLTALSVPLVPGLAVLLLPNSTLSLWPPLRALLLFQLIPLVVGTSLAVLHAPSATRLNRLARPLSNWIFGVLVIGLLISKGALLSNFGMVDLAAMVLVASGAFALPLLIPAPTYERAALSLTSGVRNLSLALLLSASFFTPAVTLTVLVYGLVMYLVGVPAALMFARQLGRKTNG